MRGVNKVILVGAMGNDPELRYSAGGNAVASISVATSESWKDAKTGQRQERTEWHRCVAYQKLAEIIGEYAIKGAKVYIEGQLRTRKWQDNNGVDRYTTEIQIKEFNIIDGGKKKDEGDPRYNNNGTQRSYSAPPNAPMPPNASMPPGYDSFDDDIPF